MPHRSLDIVIRVISLISLLFVSGPSAVVHAATAQRPIAQGDPPVAAFSSTPQTGDRPLAVTFTNASTDASQYAWDFGDGFGSVIPSPVHTYTTSGIYTVTLHASDGVLTDTMIQTNHITVTTPPPSAHFSGSPLDGPNPLTVIFSNSSSEATNYLWTFGDGQTSNSVNPSHTYTQTGSYTVTLQAGNGTVTDTHTQPSYIIVTEPVIAAFTPVSTTIPLTSSVQFVNSSSGATDYLWDFGDETTSTATNPSHTYSQIGTYTVTLTASNGSDNAVASEQIIVHPGVTTLEVQVSQGSDDAEEDLSNGEMYVDSSDLELIQDSPDDQLVGIRFQNITVPQGAVVTTAYIEFEVDEGSSEATSLFIQAEAADDTTTFTPCTSCAELSGRSKTVASVSWPDLPAWSVDEKQQTPELRTVLQEVLDRTGWQSGNSMVLFISGSGRRVVEAYEGEAANAAKLHLEYYISPDPITDLNVASDTPTELGQSTTLTATISAGEEVSYEWNFGDGQSQVIASGVGQLSQVISHTYTVTGTYTVIVTASNQVSTLVETTNVTVSSAPVLTPQADFTGTPVTGSVPLTVTFSNSSINAINYIWDFGDGITINLQSALPVTHTYTQAGVYTVTLLAGDGTVTDTLVRPSYISPVNPDSPLADFAASPLDGVVPLAVTFVNSSTNSSTYHWNFGDGSTSAAASPVHTYTQAGVYTVTLHAGDGTVTDTLVKANYITAVDPNTPIADFTATPLAGVAPLTITLVNNSANATDYIWDFGDGTTENTQLLNDVTHTYTQVGKYTVTLQAGDGTVTDTLTQTGYITVTEPVVADFSPFPTTVTTGEIVLFLNNSSGATDYLWDFGDSITSTQNSPTHTYTIAGVYSVTLTASNGYDQATVSHPLTVTLAPPQADFSGGPATDPAPLTITLVNNSANATDYIWDFGDGTTENTQLLNDVTHTYTQLGQYTVTLQAGDGTVTDTLTQTGYITVTEPVVADFSPFPTTVEIDQPILFLNNSSGATAYLWDFGDGITDTTVSPSHAYSQVGSYIVTLTASNVHNSQTISEVVTVERPLRGYWSLDENSGVRLDSTFHTNHLNEFNSVDSTTGLFGLAADFEQDSQESLSIDHATQDGLAVAGNLTLVGWARLESEPTGGHYVLVSKYDWGANNRAYRLTVNSNDQLVFVTSPDGLYDSSLYELTATNTDLAADQWYHIAAVFDATAQTMVLYLDGQEVASRTVNHNSIYAATVPFMLGANLNNGTATQFFDGQMDEWRVYAEALEATEILALSNEVLQPVNGLSLTTSSPTPTGQTTAFTATIASGTEVTYAWDFGDGSPVLTNGPIISHTYGLVGDYTVVVTAANAISTDWLTETITVQDTPPLAGFISSSPDGLGQVTSFSNSSTGSNLSYEWNFGDGQTLMTTNYLPITHTYATTGTFTVILTASNTLGSDTYLDTVTITEFPSTLMGLLASG